MQRGWPAWLVPALALGIVATGLYGYNEHQLRSASLVQLENGYQGAYHSMASNVDEMQNALSKSLVTTAPGVVNDELKSAARYAVMAQESSARLPVTLHDASLQTFFGNVETECDALVTLHQDGSKLSKPEVAVVAGLNKNATILEREVRNMEPQVWNKTGAYALAAALGTTQKSPLASGFKHIDGITKALLSHEMAPSTMGSSNRYLKGTGVADTGVKITPAQAIANAKKFAEAAAGTTGTAQRLGPGYGYKGYLVTLKSPQKDGVPTYVAVSLHRGLALWMTRFEAFEAPKLNMIQAQMAGESFLKNRGYHHLAVVDTDSYQGKAVYRFAPLKNGVLFLTQPVLLQVSLHDGQVLAFDATQYLTTEVSSVPTVPRISLAQAKRDTSPKYQLGPTRLAVIELPDRRPVLVYDLLGRQDGNTFRIYVNAVTGQQVGVEKLTTDDQM